MAELVDSGKRTTFETGGMREIVDGKGRCDLLPLDVVSTLLDGDAVLIYIHSYIYNGDPDTLYNAIRAFASNTHHSIPDIMLEVAKHYEDGAKKYADRNWEKGLPLHSFIDSGVRHYLKYLRGDTDEPHDRAFVWNMVGAIRTQKTHPKLIDLPFGETKKENDIKVMCADYLLGSQPTLGGKHE